MDTLKACMNVDHIGKLIVGDLLSWPQTGTPFAKQFMKELKEVSGKSCIIITECDKKTSESQRAKALCAMKAAKDRRGDFHDTQLAKTTFWRREHLKHLVEALDKALKYLENQYKNWLLARDLLWN